MSEIFLFLEISLGLGCLYGPKFFLIKGTLVSQDKNDMLFLSNMSSQIRK